MTTNDQPHQGKLLTDLLAWKLLKKHEFGTMMEGKSRQWVSLVQSYERIPRETLLKICSVLNVPEEYFTGNVALQDLPTTVNEPQAEYRREQKKNELKIIELQEELLRARAKIIELQDELLRVMAFQKSH